ncbi:NAD-binding protein [Streptomyces indicus]|uniref:TrkA-N domain-containing protein n=1 Tax=Streptomyces indicus TaxID=417292 RepID=A0A1G9AX72_9ACTN|nr:NAD-binding protein [Streptomyces indicus]SDK31215.1 TrkA-N domain-containing protein [Streptomyces indicus]
MVVCGDDALARRLAGELREVYGERVTLVVPPAGGRSPQTGRERAGALLGRFSAALGRGPGAAQVPDGDRVVEAAELTEEVLAEAGVADAGALALVNDDDETNIRAALAARRLNPRLRLVIRLYNRKLGQHLAELLDQAALLADPDLATRDVSTTVLSDADTAAPALAAAAVAGTRKVLQADGLLLQAVEQQAPAQDGAPPEGLCTLALLSTNRTGAGGNGDEGPLLLPDDAAVAAAAGRGTVVLQAVRHHAPPLAPGRLAGRGAPLRELFSRRLRWALAGLLTAVLGLAVASWATAGGNPLHATYLTLLDLFALNDPATEGPHSRQVLQLLAALAGLLLLPVLLAAALEAFGTFRTAAALRRPPRGLSGHVVLLGLGKIGSRVLTRLRELGIPVVCVEEDPEARGIPHARRLRVPVVLGDVTEEGVLEAAKIHRAHALLALTSVDTTNLEAALYARSVKPDLGVVLRLYDDDFALAVFRTLRAAHPGANTRSRSVTTLAAPAFAGAMMGRRILGAIPVERKVLLFAALDVAEHPELRDRTVAEAFRPGAWRVVALDTSAPAQRLPDLSAGPPPYGQGHTSGLVWDLHPGQVLTAEDRVVVAATRRGLARLLGRRREAGRVGAPRRAGQE